MNPLWFFVLFPLGVAVVGFIVWYLCQFRMGYRTIIPGWWY